MLIKAKISFDEAPVVDAAKKFVLANIKDIADDDFIARVVKVAVEELQKTLKIEFEKSGTDLNVFKECKG